MDPEKQFKKTNIRQHIHEAFQKFGIEGTEQVIKEVMGGSPTIQEEMLKEYNEILTQYKGGGH